MFDVADANSLFSSMVITIGVVLWLCALVYLIHGVLKNPFKYPYFDQYFDISFKRNVKMGDYIDNFLCDSRNWNLIKIHEKNIRSWKAETEQKIQTSILRQLRTKQYQSVLDDDHAFRFIFVRKQTRYRQRNYVKTPYEISVIDTMFATDKSWLTERFEALKTIGFEATLNDYLNKNQRKLMTQALRKQIMERDFYTCQICGKYMPDEVGLHIDHIIPVSKGGKSVPSNLRVLCSKCNGRKGAKCE